MNPILILVASITTSIQEPVPLIDFDEWKRHRESLVSKNITAVTSSIRTWVPLSSKGNVAEVNELDGVESVQFFTSSNDNWRLNLSSKRSIVFRGDKILVLDHVKRTYSRLTSIASLGSANVEKFPWLIGVHPDPAVNSLVQFVSRLTRVSHRTQRSANGFLFPTRLEVGLCRQRFLVDTSSTTTWWFDIETGLVKDIRLERRGPGLGQERITEFSTIKYSATPIDSKALDPSVFPGGYQEGTQSTSDRVWEFLARGFDSDSSGFSKDRQTIERQMQESSKLSF